jgi:Protein of unknown function/Domain of unknown function (DUF1835)
MITVHVTFSMSAAESLRSALGLAGRSDEVVAMSDDLSFGPINPPDVAVRANWVEEALGFTDWAEMRPEMEQFWSKALSESSRRVVWVSRRSTREFCGFLEWLRRNGERPFEVIDLTDAYRATGMIHDRQYVESRLWELARPLAVEIEAAYRTTWERLCCENAPLRMLTPRGLESAPLDVFDNQILSYVGEDWIKAALLVGHFLAEWAYGDLSPAEIHQTGDVVPIARIAALIASGKLDGRGDPYELRTCTVRRGGGANP